jgi:hypothetical protein
MYGRNREQEKPTVLRRCGMIPGWAFALMYFIASVGVGLTVLFYQQHRSHVALWTGFAVAVLICLIVTLQIRNDMIDRNEKREAAANAAVYSGRLIPGNEKTPLPLPTGVPEDAVTIFLGDNMRVISPTRENYVFRSKGEQFLSIGIQDDGTMLLNATILDSVNNRIAKIIDNEFQADPQHAFNPKQPDEHSLVVRDSEGIEVLNVKFLNPKAIRVVGRFYLPGYSEPVEILPEGEIHWPVEKSIRGGTFIFTAESQGFIDFP